MKEAELRKHLVCDCCAKKISHTGLPIFWRVKVERFGIDATAVKRQQGLTDIIGNAALAMVMGPDEDMTIDLMEPKTMTLCESCVVSVPIAICLERE